MPSGAEAGITGFVGEERVGVVAVGAGGVGDGGRTSSTWLRSILQMTPAWLS